MVQSKTLKLSLMNCDLLLKNGVVIDGSGKPRYRADVAIKDGKIAAIGFHVKRWVTMHGFSVNIAPDLSHFGGIVPCGIEEFGVTSLARLGLAVDFEAWDAALLKRAGDFLAALERPCPPESGT